MTQLQPLVSIGMPVYNGEKYIRHALDSLLSQSFTNFELIISDNASTDRTEIICREYAALDTRITYTRQNNNLGAAANFQFVLDQAHGEFFFWAAYDDYWAPDFIAHSLEAMKDKSIGFVFPSTVVKSIHLYISKKIPTRLFKGFENSNRKQRVLSFANLHQYSYKCNLVYSFFRTNIIRQAYSIQDISNEFILSMLILWASRGAVMNEYKFYKQYSFRWPGVRKIFPVKKEKQQKFEKWRDDTTAKAKHLFPELSKELELIRLDHKPANYHPGYKIVKNLTE